METATVKHSGPHDYGDGTGRCRRLNPDGTTCGVHYYDTITWQTPDGRAPPLIQAYIDKVKAGTPAAR